MLRPVVQRPAVIFKACSLPLPTFLLLLLLTRPCSIHIGPVSSGLSVLTHLHPKGCSLIWEGFLPRLSQGQILLIRVSNVTSLSGPPWQALTTPLYYPVSCLWPLWPSLQSEFILVCLSSPLTRKKLQKYRNLIFLIRSGGPTQCLHVVDIQ